MRRTTMLILGAVLLLGACSSATEVLVEQIAENEEGVANVAIDDGEVTVEFEDEEGGGSMVIGGGEVPADLPIPIPSGGTVMTSVSQGGSYAVILDFDADRFDEIEAFYADWVAAQSIENGVDTTTGNPRTHGWSGEIGGATFAISLLENLGTDLMNLAVNWEEG